eukprot:2118975-Rhodomonas_salina.1
MSTESIGLVLKEHILVLNEHVMVLKEHVLVLKQRGVLYQESMESSGKALGRLIADHSTLTDLRSVLKVMRAVLGKRMPVEMDDDDDDDDDD